MNNQLSVGFSFFLQVYKGGRFVFFNLHEIRILQYMPNKISLFLNPISILNCDFALAYILIKLAFLPLLHLEIPSWLCHDVNWNRNSVGLNLLWGINHFLHFSALWFIDLQDVLWNIHTCICVCVHTQRVKLKKKSIACMVQLTTNLITSFRAAPRS